MSGQNGAEFHPKFVDKKKVYISNATQKEEQGGRLFCLNVQCNLVVARDNKKCLSPFGLLEAAWSVSSLHPENKNFAFEKHF